MEAAVVDKIVALAPAEIHNIGGLEYTDKPLTLIKKPVLVLLKINTLQGLVDAIAHAFEGVTRDTELIHIVDQARVDVLNVSSDDHAQRTTILQAAVLGGDRSFKFNEFISQEEAIIGLQACFTDAGDRNAVLKTISSLAANDSLQVEDNGLTQNATAKSGIAMLATVDIKPRVTLAPYRTFREVEQPASEFVLRIKKGADGLPKIGLFEADGGAWKMDAIHNVRDWVKAALPDWSVIA